MNPLVAARIALVVTIFFIGWLVNGWRWEVRYQKLDTEYQAFSAGVAKLGEQAEAKNALQALNDLKAKERADEQNRITIANLRVGIKRLRNERDSARRSGVPPAPAGTSRPDLACFDRAELERAYGDFVTGVRGLADESTEATVNLNTAKQWASEVRLKLSTTLKE